MIKRGEAQIIKKNEQEEKNVKKTMNGKKQKKI
jgi:hypothetical protein